MHTNPLSVRAFVFLLPAALACSSAPRHEWIGPISVPDASSATGGFQDVAWSPDGRRLAFTEYLSAPGSGGPPATRVVVANADGTGDRTTIDRALWVTFSPRGDRLAFSSMRDGNWEIYTAAPDGTDVRRVTDNAVYDSQPTWSPRGDRIAFTSNRDGKRRVYTMAPDGSDARRVTTSDADDFNPAWSDDGSRLVFYRERGDDHDQVYVVRADGSDETRVTRLEDHNTYPCFCAGGALLFHRSGGAGPGAIVELDPATGESRVVTTAKAFFARPSPDGRHLAIIAGERRKVGVFVARCDGTSVWKIAG
ncbi:MAG TPA: hypothetical protein VKE69_14290 [Planctomycetota bacterium]|nr:hypothetical protein [Planctomycetota bacterium]